MPEAIRWFIMVTCLLLLGILFLLYVGEHVDIKQNLLHRAWCSLVCAYLKMDIRISEGVLFIKEGYRRRCKEEFAACHPQGILTKQVDRKKRRLREIQSIERSVIYNRRRYNLKILE